MKMDGFLETVHKRYWKVALWVNAAITLVVLLVFNLFYLTAFVDALLLSVAFSLLFSAVYTAILRNVSTRGNEVSIRSFMTYAVIRLLTALALIGGYVMIKEGTAREMMPALIIFCAYFILLDAVDAYFMVKMQKAMGECQ